MSRLANRLSISVVADVQTEDISTRSVLFYERLRCITTVCRWFLLEGVLPACDCSPYFEQFHIWGCNQKGARSHTKKYNLNPKVQLRNTMYGLWHVEIIFKNNAWKIQNSFSARLLHVLEFTRFANIHHLLCNGSVRYHEQGFLWLPLRLHTIFKNLRLFRQDDTFSLTFRKSRWHQSSLSFNQFSELWLGKDG